MRALLVIGDDGPVSVGDREFVPAIAFVRTDDQRRDQQVSWDRPDRAFFAAGACHVLAFRFIKRHQNEGYHVVYLRPLNGAFGSHVYVTDGIWAFDFNGWTPEVTLLEHSRRACREIEPDWNFRRVVVEQSLDEFCLACNHRPPGGYAFDPRGRADAYLDLFDGQPPVDHRV